MQTTINSTLINTATNLLKAGWNGWNGSDITAEMSDYINATLSGNAVEIDEETQERIQEDYRKYHINTRSERGEVGILKLRELKSRYDLACAIDDPTSEELLGMAIEEYTRQRIEAYAQYAQSLR